MVSHTVIVQDPAEWATHSAARSQQQLLAWLPSFSLCYSWLCHNKPQLQAETIGQSSFNLCYSWLRHSQALLQAQTSGLSPFSLDYVISRPCSKQLLLANSPLRALAVNRQISVGFRGCGVTTCIRGKKKKKKEPVGQ